ncbi:hypothetical protein [Streptomyces sp. NRRL F-2747]|uniref:hypothetical protein n=1 Tax=Streptomyces sp. NRRL F-2747 TaxID=1463843 RepID=UPI0004C70CCD|nr:hypothetical protein [Streptomyces sp. NRRL F-2747]
MDEMTPWKPGEVVPQSGIYPCDFARKHLWSKSTDVRGHRFPPLPYDCADQAWTLRTQAHPDTD